MSYVDTCCLMAFIWSKDRLRIQNSLGSRKAESLVPRNHPEFRVPMPAVGEAVCKIMDKNNDEHTQEIFQELERLIRNGFIKISYLKQDASAFVLTSRIMSMKPKDERDSVSAMDALIVASSATDPDCEIIYTEDNGVAFNWELLQMLNDWRSQKGYPEVSILRLLSASRCHHTPWNRHLVWCSGSLDTYIPSFL